MTKRRWRELKRQREIEALRVREIEELERRRLVGIKSIPAVGHDANMAPVRTVFVPTGELKVEVRP